MWRYVLGIVCIHLPCLAISYCHMFHHDIHHNGGRRIWGRGNVKRNISIDSEQNLHIYTSMDSYWHLLVHKLCNVDVTSGVTSQYSGKWRHRGQNVNLERCIPLVLLKFKFHTLPLICSKMYLQPCSFKLELLRNSVVARKWQGGLKIEYKMGDDVIKTDVF